MTPPPSSVAAVAVGGAVGAVVRYALSSAHPDGSGFPWTTFAINVSGALLLALIPALAAVRRSPTWAAGLGSGLLGGYTTLSTYSEQTRALLDAGHVVMAVVYVGGTLAACVAAVTVADRFSSRAQRAQVAAEGGDE